MKRKIDTEPCCIPEDTGDKKGMEVQPAHAVKVRRFPLLEETHGPHRLPPAEAGSEHGMEACPILKRKNAPDTISMQIDMGWNKTQASTEHCAVGSGIHALHSCQDSPGR